MPDSASGLKLARSSMAMRTSSAQSRSSGVKVTNPSRSVCSASNGRPAAACTAARPSASPKKRVCNRVRSLPIGSGPRFIGPTVTAAGCVSGSASSKTPDRWYERSAASASSSSEPAKQLPGSTNASRLRLVTSSRLSVRLRYSTISPASHSRRCSSSSAS